MNNKETKEKVQITALVPVCEAPNEKNAHENTFINDKRYRKTTSGHILYIRLYFLFFFAGACIFASKKINMESVSEKIVEFLRFSDLDFASFCVRFSPLVFGSFFVYASGFTMYAPFLSVIYSSSLFFVSGITSSAIVFETGASLNSLGVLLLVGVINGICIVFCSITRGISRIASSGIGQLGISDGLLYTASFFIMVICQYFSIKGVFLLVA